MLIAITGNVSAGKTTLAKQVAAEMGLLYLSSDVIRLELTRSSLRSGSFIFDEMRRRLERELHAGRGVVLDSTGMSPTFRKMLAEYRTQFVHIHLRCTPAAWREREAARMDRAEPVTPQAYRHSCDTRFMHPPDVVIDTTGLDFAEVHRLCALAITEQSAR